MLPPLPRSTLFPYTTLFRSDEALTKILTHPNAVIGLGDGGAHVQFHGGYGYITKLLGEWVREKQVMSLEQAVRRLTFDSRSEEHTSELQSQSNLVCRLLLEK